MTARTRNPPEASDDPYPSAMDDGVRILIADRHPLYRAVLRDMVAECGHVAECLEAQTLDQVHAQATGDLALALIDLSMDRMDGFAGLLRLAMAQPLLPIVVVAAMEAEELTRRALICGAAACISKSQNRAQILTALQGVLHPATPSQCGERLDVLTARERMVLEALVRGSSNKRIAFELQVTDTTVKAHVSSVLRKLGVHSRTQAVIKVRGEDAPI